MTTPPRPAQISLQGPRPDCKVEIDILFSSGPLVISGIYDWTRGDLIPGLYRIYHRRHCASIGPFYASIPLAERGLRKALTLPLGTWDQELAWYGRQEWLVTWIRKNMGAPSDLVGGEWIQSEAAPGPPTDPRSPVGAP